jgi:hypothetical protein
VTGVEFEPWLRPEWDVWFRQSDGSFVQRRLHEPEWETEEWPSEDASNVVDVVFADFTNDGIADRVDIRERYLFIMCCFKLLDGHEATVWRGVGDGTFVRIPMSIRLPYGRTGLKVTDFDSDGQADLVIGSDVFMGNGDGTFRSGPTLDADLGALVKGKVVARRGHVYAPLLTRTSSSRTPVSLEVEESGGLLVATVKSPTNLPPRGTMLLEYEGWTKLFRFERGMADLTWNRDDKPASFRVTYSGDEQFTPATTVLQRSPNLDFAKINVTLNGRDRWEAKSFVAGQPMRVVIPVTDYAGKPAAGGTITVHKYGTDEVLLTRRGTSAEMLIETPELLVPGDHLIFVRWSGGGGLLPTYAEIGFRVVEPTSERRRSVR